MRKTKPRIEKYTFACYDCDHHFPVAEAWDEFGNPYPEVDSDHCPKCGSEEIYNVDLPGKSDREDFHADG